MSNYDYDTVFLKEGHTVWIDQPLNGYYTIVRREPFDYVTGEEDTAIFTTVASGADSGFRNIAVLEPDNNPLHLYQCLWGVQDVGPVKYYMKIPTGQNRFGIDDDKEIGYVNADRSPYYNPNPLFQFYLIDEWYPSVNCSNDSAVTIMPKIWFMGMKYDIVPITDPNKIRMLETGQMAHRRIFFGGVKNTP